jgi:hypothetical protein
MSARRTLFSISMTITLVRGDIRQTSAQAILLGLNTRGQAEVHSLETLLRDQYPVLFSEYRRLGRNGEFTPGQVWFFKDSQPWFVGAMIRETANGVSRLRFLEQALVDFRHNYQRESLRSLAVAPMGSELEWLGLKTVLQEHLHPLPIPVFLYETYIAGQKPDEPSL